MALKIVFMGTPPFALTILKALHEQGHDIVAVYSQPPRKSGRGHQVIKSPVHLYAEEQNIPVLTPESFRDVVEKDRFRAHQCDVAVVAAYGLLLPRAVLEAPPGGCVNVHGSLLPRWRGAAPVQYALMAGDAQTGVCLMKMDVGMDTGPVFAQESLPLTPTSTTPQVLEELAHLGASLLRQTLKAYVKGDLPLHPQREEGVTYAPKIPKEMSLACFAQTAGEVERRVRALGGVWFTHAGCRLKVLEAAIEDLDKNFPPDAWGVVQDDQLGIACARGLFRPRLLQKEGARAQDRMSFLRGYTLASGARLQGASA